MGIMKALGAYGAKHGVISGFYRQKRLGRFTQLLSSIRRPVRILDLGGTESYWRCLGIESSEEFQITVLNLKRREMVTPGFVSLEGNVCDLSTIDPSHFDVVHSNSVIEHLFTFENQQRMAFEVRRLGLPFWIQTPNFWFPIEPHFHWLGWQWYPRSVRLMLIQRLRCGMIPMATDNATAASRVDEVRLMTYRELQECFPGAHIYRERFGPMTKSLIVVGGF